MTAAVPPARALRRRAAHTRAWLARHRPVADLLVPLLLAGVALGPMIPERARWQPWWWLVAAGVLLPLAWRRDHPVAVFGTILAAAVALTAADAGPLGLLAVGALLISLYTVAAQRPRRPALVAAAIFEVWAVVSLVRWSPPGAALPGVALMTGTAVAAVMTGFNGQTRRAYLAALEERAARLEFERDQQAKLAVATERTRIAREVHDIVTHSLSVMVTLADGAAATAPKSPGRSSDVMRQVAATGRQAIGEMRRIVGTLRVDTTEADRHPTPGLLDLEDLLSQVRAAGLPTRLLVTGRPQPLTPGAQLAVYRIVQESLTNIMKHAASAISAVVLLAYRADGVDVEITDDGRPASGCSWQAGHGVTGMRERATAYGGTVDAGPGPDGGWRVHARLGTEALLGTDRNALP